MLETMTNGESLQSLPPEDIEDIKEFFFTAYPSFTARVTAIEGLLRGPQGPSFRLRIGRWVVDRLPSKELVPEKYAHWRPLVEDAMLYWFEHLSSERLASKLVEQLELPSRTPTGERLLKLIARVPGLQKLGQVLARNRNLHPHLRKSLTDLENGISDMRFAEVRQIIVQELGPVSKKYAVTIRAGIFSEASVSAVVRFTWRNVETKTRERGVFKVMKPYIPTYFAEDMRLLAGLATYVGTKGRKYGFAKRVLPETFSDVRRLLQHEVEFEREQKTLGDAFRLYGTVLSLRVPRVIRPLCTPKITAMTEERGQKVTDAAAHMPPWRRARLCELLIEAFVAVPLFSTQKAALFHADPHAGNLLYDKRSGTLVLLDWALTERLTREERRYLAMLFFMTTLRDPNGIHKQILALSRGSKRRKARDSKIIRTCVDQFISRMPLTRIPGGPDALHLLEEIAVKGVRLPAPLIMMRKVLFTLDGVQHDIGGPVVNMMSVLVRHAAPRWLTSWSAVGSPLSPKDWLDVQSSTLRFGGRLFWQGTQHWLTEIPARTSR